MSNQPQQPQGLKDKALQAYYEALFAMYPTAGWAMLMEDLTRLRQIYADVVTVETERELDFRKGQINVVDQMLTHAARSEYGYAAAVAEETGEDAEDGTGGIAKVVETPAEPK
jgi:hypothetical protein